VKEDVDARVERGHDEVDGRCDRLSCVMAGLVVQPVMAASLFASSWPGFVPAIHALEPAG